MRLEAVERDGLAREQRRLQPKQLVIRESSTRPLGRLRARGEVGLPKGTRERHEPQIRHERGGYGVAGVTVVCKGGGLDAPHPGGRQALGNGMHGKHARIGDAGTPRGSFATRGALWLGGVLHLGYDLVKLRPHLSKAKGKRDLARDGHGVSGAQLLREPRLLEESAHEHSRGVDQRHLNDLHAWLRPFEGHLVNGANHRDLASHVRMADGGHTGEVEVAMGHVHEGIADRPHANARERLRSGGARVAQA